MGECHGVSEVPLRFECGKAFGQCPVPLENRARLLEVAAQVFGEQGLDTAPTVIAKRAGVGVGSVDGTLRTDITSDEILLLLGGLAYAAQHGTAPQAERLVDLVMDALTKK